MKASRMVLYAKDIQRITGKGERTARKILAAIRKKHNKERHQMISITEFCQYMQLDPGEVMTYL